MEIIPIKIRTTTNKKIELGIGKEKREKGGLGSGSGSGRIGSVRHMCIKLKGICNRWSRTPIMHAVLKINHEKEKNNKKNK